MASDSQKAENPTWSYASRTLRADDPASLKQLALLHHREPLRQYLVVRLGSDAAARTALDAIAGRVAALDPETLVAAPGPRARLFRLARELVSEHLAGESSGGGADTFLQHGEAAASGMRKLSLQHGELLELRHARELSPVEIAHVLDVGEAEVAASLREAEQAGAEALGVEGARKLTLALARTFAVTPDPSAGGVGAEPAALAEGDVIGERYTLERAVGIGAFGQVYRATDKLVEGHQVALKILHQVARGERQRQAALRELRLIASVFHPSIVSFKDHGWHEDRFWFVMPWYDGEPLEDRIAREPLSRDEALSVFTPLAHALASMHAAGVRHQDIKPENIFLAELKTDPLGDDQLQPVLLDLGVAATEADSLIAGTPAYFAPEVAAACAGQPFATIAEPADVFSLALALRNALEPETAEEVEGTAVQLFIAQRAHQSPPPPAGKELSFLSPHFGRWLSHEPEDRPSAAQFAGELQVLLEPERRAQRRAAFLAWFVPVAATFLLLIAGGAFLWSQQKRAQDRRAHAAELQVRNAALAAEREARLRATLEAQHGALQEEHAETSRAKDELAGALEDREAEAEKLSARAATLARMRRETAKALQSTEAELGDLTARAEQLSLTKSQLEGRVDELNGRVKELLGQAKSLDGLLEENRQLLTREQAVSRQLRNDLERANETHLAQSAQLEQVESERDEMRVELRKSEALLALRDRRIEDMKQRQQQLERELDKLKRKLKKAGGEDPSSAP